MPKKKLPKSIAYHWCYRESEYIQLISFYESQITTIKFNCLRNFIYTFQVSCIAKSKSVAHSVSSTVPRFTGMVWGVNGWLLSGKSLHFSMTCFYCWYRHMLSCVKHLCTIITYGLQYCFNSTIYYTENFTLNNRSQ